MSTPLHPHLPRSVRLVLTLSPPPLPSQLLVDTDRVDPSRQIDLTQLCNSGLFKVEPLRRQFGFQLTDEVSQSVSQSVSPVGWPVSQSAGFEQLVGP